MKKLASGQQMNRKEGHPVPPQLSWFLNPRSLTALQRRFSSAKKKKFKKAPKLMTGECWHFGPGHSLTCGAGGGFAFILLLHGNWLLITQCTLIQLTEKWQFFYQQSPLHSYNYQNDKLAGDLPSPRNLPPKGEHTLLYCTAPLAVRFYHQFLPANSPLVGIEEYLGTEHFLKLLNKHRKPAFT